MGNDLIATDPIVAQNFYLEIDGENIILSGVSGLDVEHDVVTIQQNGPTGKMQVVKTRGNTQKAPDLTITRMAPADAMSDPIWKWFIAIRDKGLTMNRASARKNGSIVLYDTSFAEVGRFNFIKGWPSKIATDAVSTESNEAVKETITLVIERLDRVK
ncbi:phage tail protein [Nocardioides sp. LMS-CY]|uniref:Phage tail-like protein n=1 Tax=Nocardioides soli TaxID=1036020 RepID=A0A7W4Z1P5_9ACTN|nr:MULTISPECIES: phage tail protein [Nocardioides]MBB3041795.1 phage tail-like protein [Nocardioides soli]QWF21312.1 phage tail protein [Nocardioides sp. LMS-CY]